MIFWTVAGGGLDYAREVSGGGVLGCWYPLVVRGRRRLGASDWDVSLLPLARTSEFFVGHCGWFVVLALRAKDNDLSREGINSDQARKYIVKAGRDLQHVL